MKMKRLMTHTKNSIEILSSVEQIESRESEIEDKVEELCQPKTKRMNIMLNSRIYIYLHVNIYVI
jgi:hypothetical protein